MHKDKRRERAVQDTFRETLPNLEREYVALNRSHISNAAGYHWEAKQRKQPLQGRNK